MFPIGHKGPPGQDVIDVCKVPAHGPWQPELFPMATDLKAPADTVGTLKGAGTDDMVGTLKGVGTDDTVGTLKGAGTGKASLGPFDGMYDNPPESSSGALLKKEKKVKNLELPGKGEDIKEVKHL